MLRQVSSTLLRVSKFVASSAYCTSPDQEFHAIMPKGFAAKKSATAQTAAAINHCFLFIRSTRDNDWRVYLERDVRIKVSPGPFDVFSIRSKKENALIVLAI